VRRREDPRLLRGEGLFVADVQMAGMAHVAFLRSPYAHARIVRVDVSRARTWPGVLDAVSFDDLGPDAPKLPMLVPHRSLRPQMPYPLAGGKVRHVGEPVAAIVAESQYQAEDALEAIEVEYDELPGRRRCRGCADPGAVLLHEGAEDNLAAAITHDVGDVDRAFAEADLVVRFDFRFGRLSGQPLETRGVVAAYERSKAGEQLNVWDSTQAPHTARRVLADMLGMPQHAIRVGRARRRRWVRHQEPLLRRGVRRSLSSRGASAAPFAGSRTAAKIC
jgi:CO/xanthine dehydrogenase Mo-binding subunit